MKELKIIEEIREKHKVNDRDVITGIGDDCAVIRYARDEYILWSTDMLIEDTHFTVRNAGYERIGHKAVAVNISDIAAMGGIPKYITVNFGIPGRGSVAAIRRLYKGIDRMCGKYGVKVLGGDINGSKKLIVDISIIGFVERSRIVTRSGARPGDDILITGPIRDGKRTHLDFYPRLKEARKLTAGYKVHSMIDVSDGIVPDISRICRESGTGCDIRRDRLPLSGGLNADDALYYGESFELMFTMRPGESERLIRASRRTGNSTGYYVIGKITGKSEGMRLSEESGRSRIMRIKGFEHIRGSKRKR